MAPKVRRGQGKDQLQARCIAWGFDLALQETLKGLMEIKEMSTKKREERRIWEKEEHMKTSLKYKKRSLELMNSMHDSWAREVDLKLLTKEDRINIVCLYELRAICDPFDT
jgi:hypothetical protein